MTGEGNYEADIRWTTHGVAHIRGGGWGDIGFGQGYACARDHLPTLADQIVKVRSERARFHGAGPDGAHLASDLGYLALGVQERAPQLRDAQPSHIRQLVAGYAAGYNAWLAEALAAGDLPDWCNGAEWVRPVDELDLWTYYVDIGLLASGRNLAEIVGRAEAPGPDGPAPASPASALGGGAGASNGWCFGGDATASGHGLVVANPHFPWGGEARFWECHLTVPGELDVYGVALIGAPGVQMGFNADVAWAHTFSRGNRFTLAKLDLVPGAPTSYRYGEEVREL
ncbi:MAG: penicillin acylase family protein, partial [Aquihabitans sp.]